jgi:ABC-2 type transport system permease protein
MVRFFRQRNRVIGAFGTPVVFWLALGSGLGRSFALPGEATPEMNYLEYFFPGVVVMILLFTAIFSTYTVIEDRREGFLQGVLVAPIARWSIVLGKVLGGATIATLQGTLFLAAWPFVGTFPGVAAMAGVILIMAVVATGLTALGLCIAWAMDSTAGYHAIMNLFLMPMWLLSGSAFPVEGAAGWMQWVMKLNPLTYAHAAISALLHGRAVGVGAPAPLWLAVCICAAFTVMLLAMATGIVSQRRRDGR